jgi:hypothetical protein
MGSVFIENFESLIPNPILWRSFKNDFMNLELFMEIGVEGDITVISHSSVS